MNKITQRFPAEIQNLFVSLFFLLLICNATTDVFSQSDTRTNQAVQKIMSQILYNESNPDNANHIVELKTGIWKEGCEPVEQGEGTDEDLKDLNTLLIKLKSITGYNIIIFTSDGNINGLSPDFAQEVLDGVNNNDLLLKSGSKENTELYQTDILINKDNEIKKDGEKLYYVSELFITDDLPEPHKSEINSIHNEITGTFDNPFLQTIKEVQKIIEYLVSIDESNWDKFFNIVEETKTGSGTFISTTALTFFSPAGYPVSFDISNNVEISSRDFQSHTNPNYDIEVPYGALFTFTLNGERDRAHYGKQKTTQRWVFIGYLQDGANYHYIDDKTKGFVIPYNINLFNGTNLNSLGCSWDINNPNHYKGDITEYKADGYVRESLSLTPIDLPKLNLTGLELNERAEAVSFNVFGRGGAVFKIKYNEEIIYIYSDYDADNDYIYYLIWDDNLQIWKEYTLAPHPKFDILKTIADIWFYCLTEYYHEGLDAIGTSDIPGISQFADGLNAAIYVFEGDFTNAGLSRGGVIPVARTIIVKSIQVFRKTAKGFKIIRLTTKASEALVDVTTRLKKSNLLDNNETTFQIFQLFSRSGDNADIFKKISTAISNDDKFFGIIDKLRQLDEARQIDFIADLTKTGDNLIGSNLSKLDGEIINSREIIYNARGANSLWKTDMSLLSKISDAKKNSVFMQHIGNEAGIQELLKANVRAGCKTCAEAGAGFLKIIDEYIDDVEDFIKGFNDKDGFTCNRHYLI